MPESFDCRTAFNSGSDARLAGQPLSDNPYSSYDKTNFYWKLGWNDVDHWWGKGAKWIIKPLPPVRERRATA